MNIIERFIAGNPSTEVIDTGTGYGELYKTAMIDNPAQWLRATAQAEKFNIPSGAMYENQAALYQTLSWIHIAVKVVSQAGAVVPLKVKQKAQGETVEKIDNHPYEILLDKPNPLQSRFEFLESTVAYRA